MDSPSEGVEPSAKGSGLVTTTHWSVVLAAGYPERYAQEALGHNSKAVHGAYVRNAQVTLLPLDE